MTPARLVDKITKVMAYIREADHLREERGLAKLPKPMLSSGHACSEYLSSLRQLNSPVGLEVYDQVFHLQKVLEKSKPNDVIEAWYLILVQQVMES